MATDFSVFLEPEALRINRARQQYLSSVGLDLHAKRVFEIGAGIVLHTAFLSSDAATFSAPIGTLIRIASSACWISTRVGDGHCLSRSRGFQAYRHRNGNPIIRRRT
jgi:hypothetical protein